MGFAYVEMSIRYIKEVLEDDPIHIITTVESCANKVVTIKHQMLNSVTNVLSSEALAKWVLFDKKLRKAIPIPDELRTKINALITEKNKIQD